MIQHFIFDADGTLRTCRDPRMPCPNAPEDWHLIPGVREAIDQIPASAKLSIVSNQGGVALGYVDGNLARGMLKDTARAAFGDRTFRVYLCPHAPASGCLCRKPRPAMIDQAIAASGVPIEQTIYVGDLPSDEEAAANAGVAFVDAADFFRDVCSYIDTRSNP